MKIFSFPLCIAVRDQYQPSWNHNNWRDMASAVFSMLLLKLPQRNSAAAVKAFAGNLLCTKQQKYNFWVFPDYFQHSFFSFAQSSFFMCTIWLSLEKWLKLFICLLPFKRIKKDLWKPQTKWVKTQILHKSVCRALILAGGWFSTVAVIWHFFFVFRNFLFIKRSIKYSLKFLTKSAFLLTFCQ